MTQDSQAQPPSTEEKAGTESTEKKASTDYLAKNGCWIDRRLMFEKGSPGRVGTNLPKCTVDTELDIPTDLLRNNLDFPELSEIEVVRHFTHLSQRNWSIDIGFYPLGSCTMKYNPRMNEVGASFPGFTGAHPLQPAETVQGNLELMAELERELCSITGMDACTLQPAAGAHGEMVGLMLMQAHFRHLGQTRTNLIIPDSAHGTNPASAALVGFTPVEVRSDEKGCVNLVELAGLLDENTAGIMLTNPNTLGIFDENISQINEMVHKVGGLSYCDGANMNAIMGKARPGDMGFDVMHLNLHKTFSTPHGGGGPGAGPVCVRQVLEPYLPIPRIVPSRSAAMAGSQVLEIDNDRPLSIGKIKGFYGNFLVLVRAYAYIRTLGASGLKEASEDAVLAANYLMARLKEHYHLPYDQVCMHEFVLSSKHQRENGVHTMHIAKRLMDMGFHPPTVHFPLIVEEALMIEPTETEPLETLDTFVDAMIQIAREAREDPELVQSAPHFADISSLDGVLASRKPNVKWTRE